MKSQKLKNHGFNCRCNKKYPKTSNDGNKNKTSNGQLPPVNSSLQKDLEALAVIKELRFSKQCDEYKKFIIEAIQKYQNSTHIDNLKQVSYMFSDANNKLFGDYTNWSKTFKSSDFDQKIISVITEIINQYNNIFAQNLALYEKFRSETICNVNLRLKNSNLSFEIEQIFNNSSFLRVTADEMDVDDSIIMQDVVEEKTTLTGDESYMNEDGN